MDSKTALDAVCMESKTALDAVCMESKTALDAVCTNIHKSCGLLWIVWMENIAPPLTHLLE